MQIPTFDQTARTRLMALLDEKSLEHNTMRCDEVQAFMTALLSGPDALNPNDWLPEVLGDESLFDAKERSEVERLVIALATDMRSKLQAKMLPDLWLYEDDAGNPDFYTWCNAYLYALDVVPTDWFETIAQEEFEDLFYPIMALGGIYDEEQNGEVILHLTESELTELESELPHVLLDIYFYWQAVINKPQTYCRKAAKIGRNDPCPCGSGKKYKACCGKLL
ncbi:YecA family protein [Neisseria chenwenguii]|uniref:YecA family protein n=1 Tax=Neisseria chenwenguii TaxID=1853278 RepID=A0A220S4V7_9NEIS|nr:YecA family protein [Neisseria chenwenguii]ASK28328.1 YecA family protein [Neisseria chenwenguii]ROV55447.1 YecA family protein [Neisseria chenwenguii]